MSLASQPAHQRLLFDDFRLVDGSTIPWVANVGHERAGDETCHLRDNVEPGSR